jgi:hypothetical protein
MAQCDPRASEPESARNPKALPTEFDFTIKGAAGVDTEEQSEVDAVDMISH